jgi:hypothetical protein
MLATSPQISGLAVRIAWLMQPPQFSSLPMRSGKAIETNPL